MSQEVTLTRTTTKVTTTSAFLLNIGHLETRFGFLELLQTALGCLIIGLVGSYFIRHTGSSASLMIPELLFLMISTASLITTACLLFSCLLSISTATIIAKTLLLSVTLPPTSVLYLCSSIIYIHAIAERNYGFETVEHGYNNKLFAGVLGLINTLLYFVSTFYAIRSYRRG